MKTLLALLLLAGTAHAAQDDIAATVLYCAVEQAYIDLQATKADELDVERHTGYSHAWLKYSLNKEIYRAKHARDEYRKMLKTWGYKLYSCNDSVVKQLTQCVQAEPINYNTVGYTASYVIRKTCDVEESNKQLINTIIEATQMQVGGL